MQPVSSAIPGIYPSDTMRIPFNRAVPIGNEMAYIQRAVTNAKLATDGEFNHRTQRLLSERLGVPGVLLTNSCTSALEIAVVLAGVGPGDEVILPSFTFVSTANSVVRAGGTPVFVDIRPDTLNLDEEKIEAAITPRTKAIMPMHYAGVACAMDVIRRIADAHGLKVLEDAAHALDAFWDDRPLGTVGDFGTFSFHETKNFIAGEGGALVVADTKLMLKAEVLRNKGTDRARFDRKEVDRYTWVGVGSSCGPSELQTAFLFAQLEHMDDIDARRKAIWDVYHEGLRPLGERGVVQLPAVPARCRPNAHIYYLIAENAAARADLQRSLASKGIQASTHYVPLHSSPYGKQIARTPFPLAVTEDIAPRLVRLPLYHALTLAEAAEVRDAVLAFFA
ncbi:MAG: dTDP-4-amino-4,6-dideoxygalactose transaminase [Planctomycetota bacterium]